MLSSAKIQTAVRVGRGVLLVLAWAVLATREPSVVVSRSVVVTVGAPHSTSRAVSGPYRTGLGAKRRPTPYKTFSSANGPQNRPYLAACSHALGSTVPRSGTKAPFARTLNRAIIAAFIAPEDEHAHGLKTPISLVRNMARDTGDTIMILSQGRCGRHSSQRIPWLALSSFVSLRSAETL